MRSLLLPTMLFLLLGICLSPLPVMAQTAEIPLFEATKVEALTTERRALVQEHISRFEVVNLDIRALNQHLKASGRTSSFQLQIGTAPPMQIELELNDMRAPNYRAIASTELGEMELPRTACHTYKGVVNGREKQITRLTINKNKIKGFFLDGENEYFIEPLAQFTGAGTPKEHFIVYKIKDIRDVPGAHCGVTEMEEHKSQMQLPTPEGPQRTTPDCPSLLELATDADWEWFQMYGANSNAEILTNLNMVEGVYLSTFNMHFAIVFQNVWQTAADPYTAAGPPSSDILPEIRDEWEVNNATFMAVDRDLMHLFSAKDHGTLFGSVNGGLPAVCSDPSVAHGFTADRVGAFLTTAHEIGHNFNGVHADGSGCGAVGASIMCQGSQKSLFFSAASCTTISTYINNNDDCIVNDGVAPDAICQDLTVQLDGSGNTSVTAGQVDDGSLDGCGFATPTNVSPSAFDCNDVGDNIVTLTVENASNVTANCNATITVEDNMAPNAQCQNVTVQLDANGNGSTTAGAVDDNSSDNCTISSTSLSETSFDCSDLGGNSVTLTVNDVNGNSSNCMATVTVEDNIPPTAVCLNTTVEIQPDGFYTLMESDVFDAINSDDNCGIDNVSFPATVFDCDDVDMVFPIQVTVSDVSGNSSNCTSNITVEIGKALPAPWMTADIGVVTLGNEYCFDPCTGPNPEDGEFTITGSGNNAISSTTDNIAFAYQTVCGDKMITAKVESVDANGYGGLMIRESLADGSKQASIFSNLSNILRQETRYTTNGFKQVNSFYKPASIWLRLMRQGNWIFAYHSTNGINFSYVHGVYVPMSNCIEIGLASFTYLPDNQSPSIFSFVEVSNSIGFGFGGQDTDTEFEALNEKYQGNGKISLFPNPNQGTFTIVMNQLMEKGTRLNVLNVHGQVVSEKVIDQETNQLEWNLEGVPEGSYFLTVKHKQEQVLTKMFTITK